MSTAKTEEPTPQRLRELRRKGDVPRSKELDKTAALLGALAAALFLAPSVIGNLIELSKQAFAGALHPAEAMTAFGVMAAQGALGVALSGALGAVVSGAVQTGLVFAPSRVLPSTDRFVPGKVWAERFKLETLVNATIALTAAALGTAAAAVGVRQLTARAPALIGVAELDGPAAVAGIVADGVVATAMLWIGVAMVVAMVDAVWQRNAFLKRNRMSLQEVRDEYKRSEGDPGHKARRARAHRELLAGSTASGVARADVVVANPTRVAVGLRYRADEVDAPTVTVVGRGEAAKAIRREAMRRRVPVYSDRMVARALVELEVGDEVPPSLFEPVAVIFRWISELEADRHRR